MKEPKHLSQTELQKIQLAVRQAEQRTHVQIIPMLVAASGSYPQAYWKIFGCFFIGCELLLTTLYFTSNILLFLSPPLWLLLSATTGLIGATILPFWPRAKRLFITKKELQRQVNQQAKVHFLDEELFQTEQRVGLLIYISMFEHQACILADRGVAQIVVQEEWDELLQHLLQGLKDKGEVQAINETIQKIAETIENAGVVLPSSPGNELSDQMIQK